MPLLTVTESFADFSTGRPEVYQAGRLVDADDPVVKGRERHFEPAETTASRVRVESATAAPGERRTRTRAAKKTAKKTAPAAEKPADDPAPTGENAPADPPAGNADKL